MILLWFFIGILIILGIARYNESSKLFWTLLISYVMGFAGTKMVYDITSSDEQSNVNLTQVYSTQAKSTTLNTAMYSITNVTSNDEVMVTAFKPVSQNTLFASNENYVILSEIFGRTRDQPQILIKPPELCLQKDFLTLHDTG